MDQLIGKQIWLEYFDQNTKFEQAFKPQFCTVERRLTCVDGSDDWCLVRLYKVLVYKAAEYSHLLIRSRWKGYRIGDEKPTSVFVVPVSDANSLTDPFELDRKMFIAWGLAARSSLEIENMLRKPQA